MSPSKLTIAAALACLAFVSGCNGCHDEEAFACQSNADCTHGRWCIEEQCTSEPLDSGSLQEPHPDGGPMTTPDASRTDGSTNSPGVPTTPTDSMVEDYCEAEATCIDVCARVGGSVACDSTVRTDECAADFTDWYEQLVTQGPSCAHAVESWVECISQSSCGEVREFFNAHPDVQHSTPCAQEYFKMECIDFEPVTEYGFDR